MLCDIHTTGGLYFLLIYLHISDPQGDTKLMKSLQASLLFNKKTGIGKLWYKFAVFNDVQNNTRIYDIQCVKDKN